MGNLDLSGDLKLSGLLKLEADGGKVTVDGQEVLVEGLSPPVGGAEGTGAPPVILPPPPGTPIDPEVKVVMISSFNKTVTAGGENIVTMGIVMQGGIPTWPGMMLPSIGNSTGPSINGIRINVVDDQATIFASGGIGTLDKSGQG